MKKRIQKMKVKKGAFTKYCGGKVTDECIQKGKASPDPIIKKRANLASTFRKLKK